MAPRYTRRYLRASGMERKWAHTSLPHMCTEYRLLEEGFQHAVSRLKSRKQMTVITGLLVEC